MTIASRRTASRSLAELCLNTLMCAPLLRQPLTMLMWFRESLTCDICMCVLDGIWHMSEWRAMDSSQVVMMHQSVPSKQSSRPHMNAMPYINAME